MEIRATTITYAKHKVREKRDEKRVYLHDLINSKNNYVQTMMKPLTEYEMERMKSKNCFY